MSLSTQVMQDIAVEREHQDKQWGGADNDDRNDIEDWKRYISKQCYNINCETWEQDRYQLVKIAALAIAAIESQDRRFA